MKKKKVALILSLILSSSAIMPTLSYATSKNGWNLYSGVWYYYQNGAMKTGWVYDKSNWYYLNSDGSMAKGWKYVNGSWYYLNQSGAMKTGWVYDKSNWYYLNSDGSMAKGWKYVNGEWYYLNKSGSMVTGYLNIGEVLYYFHESGAMAHDTRIGDYLIDSEGRCFRGGEVVDDTTIEKSVLDFSVNSSAKVLNNEDKSKNNIYSPVSVYMALSLLSEGAEGDTKDEILKVLQAEDIKNFTSESNRLKTNLTSDTEHSKCKIGNSLWLNSSLAKFNTDNINRIVDNYDAEIFKEKFDANETPKKISDWVSNKTNGKVGTDPKDFKIKEDTLMKIINTLYFKDNWMDNFSEEYTQKDDFILSDKSTVQTNFMNKVKTAKCYECDDFKASSLNFQKGSKMLFILPSEDKTPDDILNDKLNKALTCLESGSVQDYEVDFKIPKFEFKSKINLNNSLNSLGLKKVYSNKADFSGFVTDTNGKVAEIEQEAYIGIDEEGAEAAAYTEIDMRLTSAAPQEYTKMELKLDRPFIFAIMSQENIPLFIGVINNPNVK